MKYLNLLISLIALAVALTARPRINKSPFLVLASDYRIKANRAAKRHYYGNIEGREEARIQSEVYEEVAEELKSMAERLPQITVKELPQK